MGITPAGFVNTHNRPCTWLCVIPAPTYGVFLCYKMDIRRSINTRMWADEWFESLNQDEKLLWLYLLTNQYTNLLGIYEVSQSRISFETGISRETLSKAFEGFQRVGKAFYLCGRYVFLVNWLKNQSMNTNMDKNARASLENLPSDVLKALEAMHLESFESLSKGLATLPEIEREKEREIETEKESKTRESAPVVLDSNPTIEQCEHAAQMAGYTAEQGIAYFHLRNANSFLIPRGKSGHLYPITNWRSDLANVLNNGWVASKSSATPFLDTLDDKPF